MSTLQTSDVKSLVLEVEDDLRSVLSGDQEKLAKWEQEHRRALEGNRTSEDFASWRDDRITQVAVSWVLTTVFVRFLEDNQLIESVWFAGSGNRRREAVDAETHYYRVHPMHTSREWILSAFDYLAMIPTTRQLVDNRAAFHQLSVSGRMADRIRTFWREENDEGRLLRTFVDPSLDTRFLGDLYQDLSEEAQKKYALRQTPEFVEEFILDQTMEPALKERPLEGFKLIDPTCGSGHFLLGAFNRLVAKWQKAAPGMNPREVVEKGLGSVFGVDINPFAVAIARFRLKIAALRVTGETKLETAPELRVNVAAGDSLLPWDQPTLAGDAQGTGTLDFSTDATEDRDALDRILAPMRYDAVVGNPPYITVKDSRLNEVYRKLYSAASGQYQLTVPFMERFFMLAKRPVGDSPAGWMGQITSNAFMKREFGKKLIEKFLPSKDLRLVVDTSGAYIPGHPTPTVIIVGKNRRPAGDNVRIVLRMRGEPGRPEIPAEGRVWRSIIEHLDDDEFENDFITVIAVTRETLTKHPWSLQGGAAPKVLKRIGGSSTGILGDFVADIGLTFKSGQDSLYFCPESFFRRHLLSGESLRVVIGEDVRDYMLDETYCTYFPYTRDAEAITPSRRALEILWPRRVHLENQIDYQKTKIERGLKWFEPSMFFPGRFRLPLSIAFPFVATHNHFVLDRGGKVFKQTAPVIKLPEGATEERYLNLIGALNSSTALFWFKQNTYPKSGDYLPWAVRYEFAGKIVERFPLVDEEFTEYGRLLDAVARSRAESEPSIVVTRHAPTREVLQAAHVDSEKCLAHMVAEQEELDWFAYRAYGITDQELTYSGEVPAVRLGERAFEIVLARKIAAGEDHSAWFERHRSTPIMEIPERWPDDYRKLVQRRIDLIESDRLINLLERPEYKRRWADDPWEDKVDKALRSWLLDRLENRGIWFTERGLPRTRSVAQLADVVGSDEELRSVIELWQGSKHVDLVKAVTKLVIPEAVPYLAQWRLKPKAMDKFRAWQHTWELQRRQDAGEKLAAAIPVPPKYSSTDFRKQSYMGLRGKLDVPKERFIHYPAAGVASDGTMLLGWAGWDHYEQFLALATLMDQMILDGADDEKLTPIVAGLGELMFWVRQWHDELDPDIGMSRADFAQGELDRRRSQIGRSTEELRNWRPPTATRGRKARR
ncbi:BREX-2 system adenine-specific DNA-methyltransferase PglX [Acidipropionibacterium jensenii]|uniref:BREX-2 system adenine-specific DNA-methyltransferase PglX n=1 Tax=Acidipropionibacterium jensenii TaxID=1749 RepID=UPI00214C03C2|nr:BREX-2 system adenine-specific DNA-methyltransferase PglX [Acidipropionibacterium jensenii]